jgi:hypothetical protein
MYGREVLHKALHVLWVCYARYGRGFGVKQTFGDPRKSSEDHRCIVVETSKFFIVAILDKNLTSKLLSFPTLKDTSYYSQPN